MKTSFPTSFYVGLWLDQILLQFVVCKSFPCPVERPSPVAAIYADDHHLSVVHVFFHISFFLASYCRGPAYLLVHSPDFPLASSVAAQTTNVADVGPIIPFSDACFLVVVSRPLVPHRREVSSFLPTLGLSGCA